MVNKKQIISKSIKYIEFYTLSHKIIEFFFFFRLDCYLYKTENSYKKIIIQFKTMYLN